MLQKPNIFNVFGLFLYVPLGSLWGVLGGPSGGPLDEKPCIFNVFACFFVSGVDSRSWAPCDSFQRPRGDPGGHYVYLMSLRGVRGWTSGGPLVENLNIFNVFACFFHPLGPRGAPRKKHEDVNVDFDM